MRFSSKESSKKQSRFELVTRNNRRIPAENQIELTLSKLASGYLSEAYARSFFEFGAPVELAHSGAWAIRRRIPGTDLFDFMAPYPLLCCERWELLHQDLRELEGVSFSGVTDPLSPEAAEYGIPFKTHFLACLEADPTSFVHPNHRRKARRALEKCSVEIEEADEFLNEWSGLYSHLTDRHEIVGLRSFSHTSFEILMKTPGLIPFVARREGVAVAAILVFIQSDRAYYHLGASSPEGYEVGASFALFWRALEVLPTHGVRRFCLGASSGLTEITDGLSRFKAGWSNERAQSRFISQVLDPETYDRLSVGPPEGYFPAYRTGEFN